jgi:2-polyprenyl-3-methyl-5-hydroxy-6-metoxy-1,4-benzoquinol methylase
MDNESFLPEYDLFRRVCESGLSVVRPLGEGAAAQDPDGWNFGTAWPPSYFAFGRMRALTAFRQAKALRPTRVLEVAAGDAALAAQLAAEGCEVVANDLRQEALEASVRTFANGARIRIAPGNIFDLDPRETGLFDLVIACEVIEHVAHTVDFLRHLARFITPSGRILLTTPNGAYFRNKLPSHAQIKDFAALEKEQFKPDADGHLFLLTPGELRALAREAGLSVDRLDLWASPLLNGNAGLRLLAGPAICRTAYAFEQSCQRLPESVRAKLALEISAVLRPA